MKSNSRTKNSLKNVTFGTIFKLVGILFPFIIKTMIIKNLGIEYLGLNSLFTSILSVLSLSELGISGALVFNMYKPIAEKDISKVNSLLKIYRDVYRIIGGIIAILGIFLLPFLKYFIKGTYPQDINIYILYLIYLFNTVLSYFLFAYKKSIWEANQLNSYNSILETITTLVMYVSQIIVLVIFKNYYVYLIFLPITTLLLNILRNYFVNKTFPQYKCEGNIEKGLIKDLYRKVKALIGHKIGTTVITSADSLVISAILGLEVLAIYSNYYLIINAVIGLITIFYTSITAGIGDKIVCDNIESIRKNFYNLTFINNWIVSWSSICLVCLFQPFMKIWMGENLMFGLDMVVLLGIYFYTWLVRRIGLTFKDAAGMWEGDFWKPYVGMVINVLANIILCKTIGVAGAVISTIIVMVCIYFPWETYVVFKDILKCSPKKYYIQMFFYMIITGIVCLTTYICCTFIDFDSIFALIFKGVICCIVPNIIFIIVYRKNEEFLFIVKKYFMPILHKKQVF